jgi:hypothetical protein
LSPIPVVNGALNKIKLVLLCAGIFHSRSEAGEAAVRKYFCNPGAEGGRGRNNKGRH